MEDNFSLDILENDPNSNNPNLDNSEDKKTDLKTKKQVPRPIKEIKGVLRGKSKQKLFVVSFEDSEKDETVTITQMHKLYAKQLLLFYEEHITKCPPGTIINPDISVSAKDDQSDVKPES